MLVLWRCVDRRVCFWHFSLLFFFRFLNLFIQSDKNSLEIVFGAHTHKHTVCRTSSGFVSPGFSAAPAPISIVKPQKEVKCCERETLSTSQIAFILFQIRYPRLLFLSIFCSRIIRVILLIAIVVSASTFFSRRFAVRICACLFSSIII